MSLKSLHLAFITLWVLAAAAVGLYLAGKGLAGEQVGAFWRAGAAWGMGAAGIAHGVWFMERSRHCEYW